MGNPMSAGIFIPRLPFAWVPVRLKSDGLRVHAMLADGLNYIGSMG